MIRSKKVRGVAKEIDLHAQRTERGEMILNEDDITYYLSRVEAIGAREAFEAAHEGERVWVKTEWAWEPRYKDADAYLTRPTEGEG